MHSTVGYMQEMDVLIIMSATVFSESLYAEENARKGIKRAGFLSNKERRVREDRKVRGR